MKRKTKKPRTNPIAPSGLRVDQLPKYEPAKWLFPTLKSYLKAQCENNAPWERHLVAMALLGDAVTTAMDESRITFPGYRTLRSIPEEAYYHAIGEYRTPAWSRKFVERAVRIVQNTYDSGLDERLRDEALREEHAMRDRGVGLNERRVLLRVLRGRKVLLETGTGGLLSLAQTVVSWPWDAYDKALVAGRVEEVSEHFHQALTAASGLLRSGFLSDQWHAAQPEVRRFEKSLIALVRPAYEVERADLQPEEPPKAPRKSAKPRARSKRAA